MLNWLRAKLRKWLGVEALVDAVALVSAEVDEVRNIDGNQPAPATPFCVDPAKIWQKTILGGAINQLRADIKLIGDQTGLWPSEQEAHENSLLGKVRRLDARVTKLEPPIKQPAMLGAPGGSVLPAKKARAKGKKRR